MAALGTVSARSVTGRPASYRLHGEGSVAAIRRAASRDGTLAEPDRLKIEIYNDLQPLLPEWRQFEMHAVGTLYQSSLWCQAWAETAGAAAGITPVIVAGREAGRLRFILPLQMRQWSFLSVLEWFGAPMQGYGFPVIERDFMPRARQWFDANLAVILARAGPVDAICLSENPHQLFGFAHPLSDHFNIVCPSPSFATALEQNFEALHQRKRSSERRRSSRKSEAGLRQMGELRFGLPGGKAARHATIDAMFRQQEERLAEKGVYNVFGPVERAFIHRLIDLEDEGKPILAPFELILNGKTQAVMLGGIHQGSYWALISSLASGAVRKHSPGEVALRLTIEACCKQGLSRIDFSTGDADYKRQWADEIIELSAILKGCSYKGLAWAMAMALRLAAKRLVKRTPWLRKAALATRRRMFGQRVRP